MMHESKETKYEEKRLTDANNTYKFTPKGGFPSIGFSEVENPKQVNKIQARGFSVSKKIDLSDILKKVPEVI
jgi:hypothetical protein